MKSFKAIIKNYDKFNTNIKLAKGVRLVLKNAETRHGMGGISSNAYGEYWFNTNNGKALFKTYELYSQSDLRMVNEIVCSRLANQLSIPCAKYEPAYLNNADKTKGVISYNFLNENQQIFSISTFFRGEEVDTYNDIIKKFREKKNLFKIDFNQIKNQLFSIMVFDLLTFQTDRHLDNLSIIIEKGVVKLSPLYDNEFAFINLNYTEKGKENTIAEFVNLYFDGRKMIPVKKLNRENGLESYNNFVKQVVNLANSSEEFKNKFKQIISKADLRPIYKSLIEEGYEINPEYMDFTIQLLDYSKQKMKQAFLEKSKQNDKGR